MRLLFAFVVFSLVFTTSPQPENHISEVIDVLSVLSRITTGIAIKSEWLANTGNLRNGAAHLLGAHSEKSLFEGNPKSSVPSVEIIKKLTKSSANLQPIKPPNETSFSIGMKLLEDMDRDLDVIHHVLKNATRLLEFASFFGVMDPDTAAQRLDPSLYRNVSNVFENLRKIDLNRLRGPQQASDMLSWMKNETMFNLHQTMDVFTNVSNDGTFQDLLNKVPTVQFYLESQKIFFTSEKYEKNFDSLKTLPTELNGVKDGLKEWMTLMKDANDLNEMGKNLSEVWKTVDEMTGARNPSELTVGLPNGIDDLELMFKDLKEEWLKKTIAGGKNLGKLGEMLEPVRVFTGKMRELDGLWKKIKDQKSIGTLKTLADSLNVSTTTLAGTSDVETAINAVQKCLSNITNPKNTAKIPAKTYRMIKTAFENIAELIEWLKIMDVVVPDISNYKLIGTAEQTVSDIWDVVHKFQPDMLTDDMKKIITELYSHKKLPEFLEIMKHFEKKFEKFEKFPLYIKAHYALGVDNYVYNLNGTGLLEALECLRNEKFVPSEILEVMKLSGTLMDLKAKSADVAVVETYLKVVGELRSGLNELMKLEKGPKRIRRRRAVLTNSEQKARDLGNGVKVLKEMEKVWKDQKKVEHVAKCGQDVDKVISGLAGMGSVWTDENKKALNKLVDSVNELNGQCKNVTRTDLESLGNVFQMASFITGAPIDAKLLKDPVSNALAASKDPNVQMIAPDFRDVGQLRLDFAKASGPLSASTMSLQPLRDFFNGIFGIKPPPKPKFKSPQSPIPSAKPMNFVAATTEIPVSSTLIVLIIVIPLLLAALGGGMFGIWWFMKRNDYLFWHRLLMKKEKFEELLVRNSRYLSFQEEEFKCVNSKIKTLLDAVTVGSLKSAESFIAQGAWINAERETNTCLHIAVLKANVEMVELLIRNGADRNALNKDFKTPEELIAIEIEKCEEAAKEKTVRVDPDEPNFMKRSKEKRKAEQQKRKTESAAKLPNLNVLLTKFEELKDQNFLRVIPPLYPINKFRILISENCENTKFSKKFASNITENIAQATHLIVKVDKDGVYEPDEPLLNKISMLIGRTMIMKDTWIAACLKKTSNMRNDFKFQVEKVKVNGQIYSTLKDWHLSFHMKQIPYLRDTQMLFLGVRDHLLDSIAERLGITLLNSRPDAMSMFNYSIAHPYHLFNCELMWILYPTSEKTPMEKTEDWRKLTIAELLELLLKREMVFNPEKIRYSPLHDSEDPENVSKVVVKDDEEVEKSK